MFMEPSPRQRTIERLAGDADAIRRRGGEIEMLGTQMGDAATFLQRLAEDTGDQRGKAIEKLREVVGDTYAELRRAGDMYRPTGPVLVAYAKALAEAQPRANASVRRCEELWSQYVALPGYLDGDRPAWGRPDEGTPEADDAAADDAAKQGKHDDFVAEARLFDAAMDTWETAFDTAANGIGDVLDGKIKDGFWDDVDGFVGGVVAVLQVVGMIVAIATIIIGGPIVALIAGIVGVLTLALTIYQYARGDTGLTQLVLAVVGVIPFGSLGKLFKGGSGALEFAGDAFMAFKPSSWTAAAHQVTSLRLASTFAGGGWQGLAGAGRQLFTEFNPNGVGDVMSRLVFGKDVGKLEGMIEGMTAAGEGVTRITRGAAAWEFAYTLVSGPVKLANNVATWTGHKDQSVSSRYPVVGALL